MCKPGDFITRNCPGCIKRTKVKVHNHFQWVCPTCHYVGNISDDFELKGGDPEGAPKQILQDLYETFDFLEESHQGFDRNMALEFTSLMLSITGLLLFAPREMQLEFIEMAGSYTNKAIEFKRMKDAKKN